jgi:predicted ribosome quality control (RQC) complex YloA/Tae2 family protein
MQIPNISLAYEIAELSPLIEDSILRKVQELSNSWLKLKLQTRQGTKDLVITPNAFFVTSYSLPAKQNTSGFGAFLRKRISNKKILSLKQHSLDRITLLEFDEYFLVLELFAKGNIILVTKEFEIVSAYRKEQWKDRKISKGQPYKFPSSKGLSPLDVTPVQLKEIFSNSTADCIRTLVSSLNIAPFAGEEACIRAKVEKTLPATKLSAPKLKKLLTELKGIYSIDLKNLKPGISGKQLLPFKGESIEEFEPVSSLNEAIDELFSKDFAQKRDQPQKSPKEDKLEKNLKSQFKSKEVFEEKVLGSREAAEAIYANYLAVSKTLELAKGFAGGKIDKEEIMYKLSELGFELKEINLKTKKIVVELKN